MKLAFALLIGLISADALAQRSFPGPAGAVVTGSGGGGAGLFETLGIIFLVAIAVTVLVGIAMAVFQLLRWLLSLPVALWRKTLEMLRR